MSVTDSNTLVGKLSKQQVVCLPTCISFFLSVWRAAVSDCSLLLKLLTCSSKFSRSLHGQRLLKAAHCWPYISP